MTYRDAVEWLYGLQLHGIKLGLDNMRALCAALEIDLGPGFPEPRRPTRAANTLTTGLHQSTPRPGGSRVFIHVAGTNGKGSVCAMLHAICRRAGICCGLYTSPHLVTFRERIQVDGARIPEAEVAAGLTRIRGLVEAWDHPPTFFEVTTALALHWFQGQHTDVVILETGLGGRLDATNVVTPAVSVLTPIGMDHQNILGDTLADIAREKCGIIKSGVPVVSAPQQQDAAAVILATGSRLSSPCQWVTKPCKTSVGLHGTHQRWNAALAVLALNTAAVKHPSLSVPLELVEQALVEAEWPGRFQIIEDELVLDGAHNPGGALALVNTWQDLYGPSKAMIILGMMGDKDVPGFVNTLTPIADRIFAVAVDNERAIPAAQLAAEIRAARPEIEIREFSSLAAALEATRRGSDRVLITGSLYLVGEALVHLQLAEPAGERSRQ